MGRRKIKNALVLAGLLTFSLGVGTLTSCQGEQAVSYTTVTIGTNVTDGLDYLSVKLFDISGDVPRELSFGTSIPTGLKVRAVIDVKPEHQENCIISDIKLNSKHLDTSTDSAYEFVTVEGTNEITVELDVLHLITINADGDTYADVFVSDDGTKEISKAKAGTKLYVYIRNNKKEVKEVRINDSEIVRASDGRYGFTMPDGDVTVSVLWGEEIKVTHTIRINLNGETVANGAVKVTNSKGENVALGTVGETITVTVNHIKYVSELKVNETSVKESETRGVYTFVMPDKNVTIDISWVNTSSLSLIYNESEFESVKLINKDTKEEAEISIKKTTLDVGEEYTLVLDTIETYSVTSVALDGSEISYVEADGGYTFTVLKDSSTLSITTTEIKLAHNINYSASSSEIPAENVSFYVNNIAVTSAKEGEVVTIKFVAGKDYVITGVYFNGKAATKVTETEWTFVMPDEVVTIIATTKTTKGVLTVVNNGKVSYINESSDGLIDSKGQKIDITSGSAILDIGETYTLTYSSAKENFDVSVAVEGATVLSSSYDPETRKGNVIFTVKGDLKVIVSEKEKDKVYSKVTITSSVSDGLNYLDYSLTAGEGENLKEIISGEEVEVGTIVTLKANIKEENSEFVSITAVKIGETTIQPETDGSYVFEVQEDTSAITIDIKVLGKITIDTGDEIVSDGAITLTNKDGEAISFADVGEEVTVNIKHTKAVEKVTVNGLEATLVEEGIYKFTMPSGDAKVTIEWSQNVKVKIEGGLTDVSIDFRNVDENGLTLGQVNMDWANYTANLEIGQRYALRLTPYSGYQIDSVLIDDVVIQPDSSNGVYYFVCEDTTSVIKINTSEVIVGNLYNISFDAGDSGVDPSTVRIQNIDNGDLVNQGEEGHTIWVFFDDVYHAPKHVYINGVEAVDMSSGMGTTWQFIMPAEDVIITCDLNEGEEPVVGENKLTIINNTGGEIINATAGDGLSLGTGAMMTPIQLVDYSADLEANKEYTLYFSSSLENIEITTTSNIKVSYEDFSGGVGTLIFTYYDGPACILFEPGMSKNEFRMINFVGSNIIGAVDGLFPSSAMGASILNVDENSLNGTCVLTSGETYTFYYTINDLGSKTPNITIEGEGIDVTTKSYDGYGTVQFSYTSGPVKFVIELL